MTTFCAVLEPERQQQKSSSLSGKEEEEEENNASKKTTPKVKRLTKSEREKNSKEYEWAAWISGCGITSIAITATYFRLLRDYNLVDERCVFPTAELFAQLALIAGAAVGMEFYARFAHKYLWHDVVVHADEIQERLEQKDLVVTRVAPFAERRRVRGERYLRRSERRAGVCVMRVRVFTPGVFGGLCFGAGLGITLFGIAYMYVHDGMVHKRFPTGPLGKLPWLRRVAAGHAIHHTEKFEGVPWGLFFRRERTAQIPGRYRRTRQSLFSQRSSG